MRKMVLMLGLLLGTGMLYGQAIPELIAKKGSKPIQMVLEKLEVKVVVEGILAKTSMTMTFRNKLNIQLAGDLYFPLPEGATVSGYALDINGKLIDGVVVSKRKARVAYEKEVRRGVDPGLIEWTKGNVFKTRVFPIPPLKTRTIRVEYVSELEIDKGQSYYRLPLSYKQIVDDFSIQVDVSGKFVKPEIKGGELANFKFKRWQQVYIAKARYKKILLDKSLVIAIASVSARQVIVEKCGDEYFFMICSKVQVQPNRVKRMKLNKIAIVWDASGSRDRNHDKEYKLLKEFFNSLTGTRTVDLYVLRNKMEKLSSFKISRNANVLIDRIRKIKYDGGTSFKSLVLPRNSADIALVFSDGLNTWRNGNSKLQVPAWVFSNSSKVNFSRLKKLAWSKGGNYFNLKKISDLESIIPTIGCSPWMFLGTEVNPYNAFAVYPKQHRPVSKRIIVCGKLLGDKAEVMVRFGYNRFSSGSSIIIKKSTAVKGDLLRRYWATLKLNDLLLDETQNKEKILALGKQYSIVTPGTSLIVLENLNQYLEYRIAPPESLPKMRKQYLARISRQNRNNTKSKKAKIDQVLKMWQEQVKWWNDPIKYCTAKSPVPRESAEGERTITMSIRESSVPAAVFADRRSSRSRSSVDSEVGFIETRADSAGASEGASGVLSAPKKNIAPVTSGPQVKVKPWSPKAPYLEALSEANANELMAVYFRFREKYRKSPGFFMDCANYMFKRKQVKQAVLILSNVCEMELENASLLRMAAFKLMDAKLYDEAIDLLKEVKQMRPEEPQSFRDLALAYSARAEVDKDSIKKQKDFLQAITLLNEVILGKWDRFFGIEIIALMELNRIVRLAQKAGVKDDQITVDPRLIKAMPLDVRIVISWDSDNTDIDLHVIEPSKNDVCYNNRYSRIGGVCSRDITTGYGPESYLLKKLVKGKYKIKAKYYGSGQAALAGPVTVRIEFFTDYGRDSEKHYSSTVRLDKPKDMVDLGSYTQ